MKSVSKGRGLKVPAKASLWYIMSGALARGIGALGTPVFTRLLTPEEYGLYPLFSTWLSLITVVVTLELTGTVIYKGLIRFEKNKDVFISATLGLISLLSVSAFLLYAFLEEKIVRLTGLTATVGWLMLTQIYINSILSLYTAKARYEYRYKTVALFNIFISLTSLFLSVLLIKLTSLKASARIIGMLLTTLVTALPIIINMLKRSRRIFDGRVWLYLLKFNLPLLPHYLSMSVILRIGEITIGRSLGQGELGKYSVALSLGLSLSVITSGILSALSPWIMRKIRSGSYGEIRSLFSTVTYALCAMTLSALTVYPEALAILTPGEYHDALGAIYPLALSVIPVFLANAVMSGESYFERGGVSSLSAILTSVATATLSILLIPRTSYITAGIITLFSYTALAFLNSAIFKRLSGEYPFKRRNIVIALCLSAAYSLIIYFFKDSIIARAVLLLPVLPLLLVLSLKIYRTVKEK